MRTSVSIADMQHNKGHPAAFEMVIVPFNTFSCLSLRGYCAQTVRYVLMHAAQMASRLKNGCNLCTPSISATSRSAVRSDANQPMSVSIQATRRSRRRRQAHTLRRQPVATPASGANGLHWLSRHQNTSQALPRVHCVQAQACSCFSEPFPDRMPCLQLAIWVSWKVLAVAHFVAY